MTPDEARRAWYCEEAEYYGYLTSLGCEAQSLVRRHDVPQAYKNARLAGHFGRLALGRIESVDQDVYDEAVAAWRRHRTGVSHD